MADVPHVLEGLCGLIVRRGFRFDHFQTVADGDAEKRQCSLLGTLVAGLLTPVLAGPMYQGPLCLSSAAEVR